MITLVKYRIKGIVQGVGFRPWLNKLSIEFNLSGEVWNDIEGVVLCWKGTHQDIMAAMEQLRSNPPPLARIVSLTSLPVDPIAEYSSFTIVDSDLSGYEATSISPDAHVCEDCLNEMFDPKSRRFLYPFINCTHCGPRYSIINSLPYDRANTSMSSFVMCELCQREYKDINDRRYHAQPTCCPSCGPQLIIRDNRGNRKPVADTFAEIGRRLDEGNVVAVKSTGGFHLVVDAFNNQAVIRLRAIKKRQFKPFAIMVKNIESARNLAWISSEEESELTSTARPIVLLRKKNQHSLEILAPDNAYIGIMLPSNPIHYLMLNEPHRTALVMTSANQQGDPIIFREQELLTAIPSHFDFMLTHNRDIMNSSDDSIVSYSYSRSGKTMRSLIRRSRGFVPAPLNFSVALPPIVALGPELKNTFACSVGQSVILSPHFGDLKSTGSMDRFYRTLEFYQRLYQLIPCVLGVDQHPSFQFSNPQKCTDHFSGLAKDNRLAVQHHHAHMASCMMENQAPCEPTLGIIFDGVGYGGDGELWGGEFLLGDYTSAQRIGSFLPLRLLGGDLAVKEVFRSALSLLFSLEEYDYSLLPPALRDLVPEAVASIYQKIYRTGIHSPLSSSIGRLFDGVAALLGICHYAEYEGQAAVELESVLQADNTIGEPYNYNVVFENILWNIDYRQTLREIIFDINNGRSVAYISRRFHTTLCKIVCDSAVKIRETYQFGSVVLSGGVFMNRFMLVNCYEQLEAEGFRVLFHQQVPSNDGGISLGQLAVASFHLPNVS